MLGLNSKVNYQGRIATIAELADEGQVRFVYAECYGKLDKPAYFAEDENNSGWQISKLAYEKGITKHPNLLPKPELLITPQPYTFAEKQAAIVSKLAGSGVEWLADVDFENWEVAYEWLMSATLDEILDFAPVIELESWRGTFPQILHRS